MPLTFERANPVAVGEKVTSTQMRNLASAFNDRMRAFKFVGWRIAWFWYNLFRQVRNPSSNGLVFPAQGEFFHIYQHLDPEHHLGSTWPVTGPGEFEGANLANPAMQFEFGVDPTLDREDVRINDQLAFSVSGVDNSTPEYWWELGKLQRGLYDPINGVSNTPAWSLAEDFFRVVQPWWSPHGKAYGGYFPTPLPIVTDYPGVGGSDCGATEATGLGLLSWEIKFTSLRAGIATAGLHGSVATDAEGIHTLTYAGTCPCGTTAYAAGHIQGLARFPFAWYLWVGTGTDCDYDIDRLPLADWTEGPYTGDAAPFHSEGQQLHRAMWWFASDFRGNAASRTPDTFKIEDIAFDFQKFYTRQHSLAPNFGLQAGEVIEAEYPLASFDSAPFFASGSFGSFITGSDNHVYQPGYVAAGMFAKATKLTRTAIVEVLSGTTVIGRMTLEPDASNNAQAVLWVQNAITPDPLKIRAGSDIHFEDATGTLTVEVTQQFPHKPNYWDAYLLLRVGASNGGVAEQSGVDGRGFDSTYADLISYNYFTTGSIVPRALGVRDSAEWVNDKPVFDAARRLSRDHMRIVRRQEFEAHEVTGGKTILYFRRFPTYPNLDAVAIRADLFDKIAPSIDPVASGTLLEGDTYIVHGTNDPANHVIYGSTPIHYHQTFVATALDSFTTFGDAQVFENDGIRSTARKKGFSNEWLMYLEPRCYHPSGSSIWKAEAYGDYFNAINRCHFYSGTANSELARFFNFNSVVSLDANYNPQLTNDLRAQANFIAPEAPDQYNYTNGSNRTYGSAEFYSSCRIYEAPYEVESCVVETWDTNPLLKITLKTRLNSHPDAPATVAKDPTTWSADEVLQLRNAYVTDPDINEDYRTDDNSVREYVLHQADGTKHCTFKTGDAGTGSGVTGLPDNPFGSCYPTFFFTRLIPEAYEDDNDIAQPHDARSVVDQFMHMEVALRAMCEGFVDAITTENIRCATGSGGLYEYTFDALCFQAFSGRWVSPFPLKVRSDNPGGFGPLPNTIMYADIFNRLASGVNLLDKVRLDIPVEFQYQFRSYTGSRLVSPTLCSGTSACSKSADSFAYLDGASAPPISTGGAPLGYVTDTGFTASRSAFLDGCLSPGPPFFLSGLRSDVEFRAQVTSGYLNAIPAPIQELIDLNRTGFLVTWNTQQTNERRTVVEVPNGDGCAPASTDQWYDSDTPADKFKWLVQDMNIVTSGCSILLAGIITAPDLLSCDYRFGWDNPSANYCNNGPASFYNVDFVAEPGAFVHVELV